MMEPKHFSHNHGLVFLQQLPQDFQVYCSGCKSPATGGVYTCRQCNYFLHEHCFGAPRSVNHPSHPLHPLSLMPFPTYPSRSFICNSCNLVGDGFSYTCSLCEFDIRIHCSHHMPNAQRRVEEEAHVRKMEMEEELRRRHDLVAMQRLKEVSDHIDFLWSN